MRYTLGFAILLFGSAAFAQGPASGRGAATAGVPPAQTIAPYGLFDLGQAGARQHLAGEDSMARMKRRARRGRGAPADAAAPAGR